MNKDSKKKLQVWSPGETISLRPSKKTKQQPAKQQVLPAKPAPEQVKALVQAPPMQAPPLASARATSSPATGVNQPQSTITSPAPKQAPALPPQAPSAQIRQQPSSPPSVNLRQATTPPTTLQNSANANVAPAVATSASQAPSVVQPVAPAGIKPSQQQAVRPQTTKQMPVGSTRPPLVQPQTSPPASAVSLPQTPAAARLAQAQTSSQPTRQVAAAQTASAQSSSTATLAPSPRAAPTQAQASPTTSVLSAQATAPAIPIPAQQPRAPSKKSQPQPDSPAVKGDASPPKQQTIGAKTRLNFFIFIAITSLIILSTVGMLIFAFREQIQNLLQSKETRYQDNFTSVATQLLQIKNQAIQVRLKDDNAQKVLPQLGSSTVSESRIKLEAQVDASYPEQAAPAVRVSYRFDITVTADNDQSNLLLDVSTFFDGQEKALFKLDRFCINTCQTASLASEHIQHWTDLNALMQNGPGESKILSYVKALLQHYTAYNYMALMPAFNIKDSQAYLDAKKSLQESSAYNLDVASCQESRAKQIHCQAMIDYNNLQAFYDDIYVQALKTEVPLYYTQLSPDTRPQNLPQRVEITFDSERNLPISLSATDSDVVSTSDLYVDYGQFNNPGFSLPQIDSTQDFSLYQEAIVTAEKNIFLH